MSWSWQPLLPGAAQLLATTGVTGAGAGTVDITGAAVGDVDVAGAGAGATDITGAATGAVAVVGAGAGDTGITGVATGGVLVAGAGAGDTGIDGASAGAVAVAGAGAGDVEITGLAAGGSGVFGIAAGEVGLTGEAAGTVSGGTPIVVIRGGDDAPPSWKKRFYDKQLKEFEESLAEILVADDPQEAAIEATQAFEQIDVPAPGITDALRDIASGLKVLRMQSLRRNEMRKEIADIRAELERVAAHRRKRRNNEAALLLLM